MPNHDPRAIANEFLSRRNDTSWPAQMKIQKLAYIAHGWNLAINGTPLINEAPEAWDNGPVFRRIWDHIRDHGYRGERHQLCDPLGGSPYSSELSLEECNVIEHVWKRYGHLNATQLSDLTHEPDTPWSEAYLNIGRNAQLSNSSIRNHYIEMARSIRG